MQVVILTSNLPRALIAANSTARGLRLALRGFSTACNVATRSVRDLGRKLKLANRERRREHERESQALVLWQRERDASRYVRERSCRPLCRTTAKMPAPDIGSGKLTISSHLSDCAPYSYILGSIALWRIRSRYRTFRA